MPRNDQLHKILLIGSGPIVIGQGCEFDYSGVQACKALREEGYEVVLVNSNPATIMTDPEFADRTYIEPISAEVIELILEREKPDAILPTMGGQTALNAAMELNRNGALVRHGVQLIGANALAIAKGEDRQLFKEAMVRIGLDVACSGIARSPADAERVAAEIGSFPLIIRPAFTLGGSGGGIAYNREELASIVEVGLDLSPVSEVLIEESLLGWKEFEMEVMRDRADNCVVVCSIENLDPMGVHTGDSITVAPAQTLTDREYQAMRDASFAVIREIGVETGGSNIQFAIDPENGRMVVIEMNPRVSRSSALASKATGFPIAKIAAKLAVGYTLDEIRNDITRETPASFEPTIDYCVVKVPRFTFEKFPEADATLTTRMKSVGEAMAIGRTFKEALQKALRSLEIKRFGLCCDGRETRVDAETLRRKLSVPNAERIFYLAQAFQDGMSIEEVFGLTKIDPWFLSNIAQIVAAAETLRAGRPRDESGGTPELRSPSSRTQGNIIATETTTNPQQEADREGDARDREDAARDRNTQAKARERNAHSGDPQAKAREPDAHSGDPQAKARKRGRNTGVPPVASSGRPARSFYFRAFDPQGEVQQRRRNLPHFEQPGATYFVSFRLGDSVPQSLLREWREEKENWLKHHPRPWDWKTEQEHRRRFVEPREEWLDRSHGSCLLREPRAARIVADSLGHFHGERYGLDAFVVMPNHVHALVQPLPGHSLVDILHSWKSFTAHALNRALDRTGDVWMAESYDHLVRDWEELVALREYIAANPARGRLAEGEFLLERRNALGLEDEQNDRPGRPLDWSGETPELRRFKRLGFSDRQLAYSLGTTEESIRARRIAAGVIPTYRLVDTCAAEFEAFTPYYYSTYGDENEIRPGAKRKIMILGGGPNRIGQGIEFDYCCVHAAFALRELGFETIMVNSNPETVSTDYDTSDKLYFEPLTHEDVLNIYEQEMPEGVIVQFGGQTPLNLAAGLKAAGVPIIGTQPESIELAEDRKLFAGMLDRLGLRQTPSGSATSEDEAVAIAERIGYPVLVRPSFVLGGRAMELVYHAEDLRRYMRSAIEVSPKRPVLVDRFLEDAIEVDVDCIADGEIAVVGAIMEHIEEAGIHSGDSACVIPTFSLSSAILAEITSATRAMAKELKVRGLMNVQFAVKDEKLYVLEVNPRASRTVPFVSKAIGVPLAKLAAKVMTGMSLGELGFTAEIRPPHYSVKEAVFPFLRFEGINISLGPEMKSTGEVMGIDADLGLAFAKSQLASQWPLPTAGNVFISVKDADKPNVIAIAREYADLGFGIVATSGTADMLAAAGVEVTKVFKIAEGRPNVRDLVKNGQIQFIINTPSGKIPREDEVKIRTAALTERIPIMTTIRAAAASAKGIRSLQKGALTVKSLQEYHAR